jgi:hypothetical protein
MPIQVNVANGSITPAGSAIGPNTTFEWLNNSGNTVTLTDCGNWLTQSSYSVAPNGGTTSATVLANPNYSSCAFRDSGWNAPGMPHIIVTPSPLPQREKDVA